MERDPLRLAWTSSRVGHAAAGLLLLAAGLVMLAGFELLRVVLDEIVAHVPPSPLLRVVATGLGRLGLPPVEIFSGFVVTRALHAPLVLAGLVAVPIVLALLLTGVGWLAAGIGTKVLARIRSRVVDAVLGAPSTARDGAAEAASIAGDVLAREGGILGAAVLWPARSAAVVALAGAYTLAMDWHLGAALAAMLVLAALLTTRRLERRIELARARRAEGVAAEGSLSDLLRRSPALRAHGTRAVERERVRQALLGRHRAVERLARRLAASEAFAAAALLLTPLTVLAAGAWLVSQERGVSLGVLLSTTVAAALCAVAVRDLAQWQRLMEEVRPLLAELGRNLAALQTRERRGVVE